MKLKKKHWWYPALFNSFFVEEMRNIHMIICWSVLGITDWSSLWVGYLPKDLHTGKTFKCCHFISRVDTVFTTTVYILFLLCTKNHGIIEYQSYQSWNHRILFPKQSVLWYNQFLEGSLRTVFRDHIFREINPPNFWKKKIHLFIRSLV